MMQDDFSPVDALHNHFQEALDKDTDPQQWVTNFRAYYHSSMIIFLTKSPDFKIDANNLADNHIYAEIDHLVVDYISKLINHPRADTIHEYILRYLLIKSETVTRNPDLHTKINIPNHMKDRLDAIFVLNELECNHNDSSRDF